MLTAVIAFLAAIVKPAKFIAGEVTTYLTAREAVKTAELNAKLAQLTAKTELAAYIVKADAEWDLAWAGQAKDSWKDEWVLGLWSFPLVVSLPALIFPSWQGHIMETLVWLQRIDPNILTWWMTGWGIIFSATFGMKAAGQMMIPSGVAKIAESFKGLPDDIPEETVKAVTGKIAERIKKLSS